MMSNQFPSQGWDDPILPSPFRLGYFFGLPGIASAWNRGITYRGIDRDWFLPSCEELTALKENGRHCLVRLWAEYWDAYDSEVLHHDRELAVHLRTRFRQEGVILDLIYAEIASIPRDFGTHEWVGEQSSRMAMGLDYWRSIHDALGARPSDIDFLGYDVSRPIPSFHSALVQPWIDGGDLLPLLNENGLFSLVEPGEECARRANATGYGASPSVVIAVWNVGQ